MTSSVLVVDDSLTVRMDLCEALEGAGLRAEGCDTAAPPRPAMAGARGGAGLRAEGCDTAAAARRAMAETVFGVIVLDVVLPDGDGIALLDEIRQSRLNARVPVMLLSTEAEVRDRVRGLARGADDFVGKPYDCSYVAAEELLGPGD